MATSRRAQPRTFFLNETHELALGEKDGGGRLPKFEGIEWDRKGKRISNSLSQVAKAVSRSADPLRASRYFILAKPVESVRKRQEDKHGNLRAIYEERTEYGSSSRHSRTFERLGLDLIDVTADGRAIVHAEPPLFDSLRERTEKLDRLGPKEQANWATIEAFDAIPLQLRIDEEWLGTLSNTAVSDVIMELQPVLRRLEADSVLRAVAEHLRKRPGEALTGMGTDYSGRYWLRGKATRDSVRAIANDFYSIQALHPPLYSIAAARKQRGQVARPAQGSSRRVDTVNIDELPSVAVVDLGVPDDHRQLARFRRGGFVPQDAARPPLGDHGSLVASRIVFGDCESDESIVSAQGSCRYFDAMVGANPHITRSNDKVDDKVVLAAMRGVVGSAPDVRVFNLSFGDTRPLGKLPDIERHERMRDLQNLDNFVFENDALVVVAAGNSERGVAPSPDYPEHITDPRWALGPWACGFNTLVCGAFVRTPTFEGLVQNPGWPSPLTRIGPGICSSPVPSFSADGGNVDANYHFRPGMGVWCLSDQGLPEDHSGTSFAAPLLAREAAFTLRELERKCEPGTRPFAVTARAFLSIAARPPISDPSITNLVERTLGYGEASVARLQQPRSGSAVMLWQGYIGSPRDIVRVQIPVPLNWLNHASEPRLRMVVCSDPPVNAAVPGLWACRRVTAMLRLEPDGDAVRAPRGGHNSYPIIDRAYKLNKYQESGDKPADSDEWLIEISYEDIASYYPGSRFGSEQRVAFALELLDEGEDPVDPQLALQALPIASTMNRLSIQSADIRAPIIVRTR